MHSESTKLIALQAQIYENYASQIKFVVVSFALHESRRLFGEVKQKTYQTHSMKRRYPNLGSFYQN